MTSCIGQTMLMRVYKQNYEYSFLFCPTLFWQPFYLGSEGETCISFHPSQLWRAWRIELVNRIQIDATLSWIDHLHKSNSIPTNMTHTKQTFYLPYRELTHLSINPDHHLSLLEGFHFKSLRVNLIKRFTSHQEQILYQPNQNTPFI